jgi:NAD+ synthase (glutamine-hydrolysing)
VFDGRSLALDENGRILAEADSFKEALYSFELSVRRFKSKADSDVPAASTGPKRTWRRAHASAKRFFKRSELSREKEVYEALVLGTRDYILKNRFKKTLIGLSGGIDSALVAAIAVDALGPENVIGVTMPSPYTSQETLADARILALNLGIQCLEFRIDGILERYLRDLREGLKDPVTGTAEENLQARIRGNILMALSNKYGYLVLTTGNKSEMATGYCTLYGDMAGGFAVIKDVPKTLVFRLARYRNRAPFKKPIPETILRRPPSAELRLNQKDQDTLPPYELLDRFLECYVEKDMPVGRILKRGIDRKTVYLIKRMIDGNEYKRRQAPPGIKITPKAFGRDRRMPITNRFVG